jgi:hypothetical protein
VRFRHLVAVSCTLSKVGGTARTSKPVAPSGPSHRAIFCFRPSGHGAYSVFALGLLELVETVLKMTDAATELLDLALELGT